MTPRFRTFQVQVIHEDLGFLVEIATIDGKQMLIATNRNDLIDRELAIYDQEGWGFFEPNTLSPDEIKAISKELISRLVARQSPRLDARYPLATDEKP
jgi:hypothetical protein